MRAIVTGAAGFIGSHLCERLWTGGWEVLGLDNFETGTRERIKRMQSRCKGIDFQEQDILDPNGMETAFKIHRPDVVFHQAAVASVPRSIAEPSRTMMNNVDGTHAVLELCRRHEVKRLVFASSSSVYGKNPHVLKSEDQLGPVTSPYAMSKLVNEIQAHTWFRVYGVDTIGLRYFNVYGPGQTGDNPYATVIAKWIDALKKKQPFLLEGDGTQSRDFTHVHDVVTANIAAAKADKIVCGKSYNVGAGQEIQLVQVMNELMAHAQRLGYKLHGIENKRARPNDPPATRASLSLVREALGYIPQIDFRTGLKLTVEAELRDKA